MLHNFTTHGMFLVRTVYSTNHILPVQLSPDNAGGATMRINMNCIQINSFVVSKNSILLFLKKIFKWSYIKF